MKRHLDLVAIVAGLLAASGVLYGVEFLLSGESHALGSEFLRELAFLPIHGIVVAVIIEGLLARRERRAMQHKLNMVIGAFFTSVGTDLMARLSRFDEHADALAPDLRFDEGWSPSAFAKARADVASRHYRLIVQEGDLAELREFLKSNRAFMLRLLENANLLEHQGFTDLLWAATHLSEELMARGSLTELSATDITHLQGDMARTYERVLVEWLRYVQHLKADYPFLFSFVVRTNPFDPDAQVEVCG